MKIAICEDNKAVAAEVENYILDFHLKNLTCDVFYNGNELLKYLETEEQNYQIYFMDIQMPMLDGIKTASYIRDKDKTAIIVFMTDYTEYVFQVFEVLPFRFLKKPITKSKLQEIICDAIDYLYTVKKFITFYIEKVCYQVAYEDVFYLESNKRKIILYTINREYLFYGKLGDIEKTLDSNIFARIHVSFLVNLEHIRKVMKDAVELDNGILLPVSKRYQEQIKEQQIHFIKWRNGI